MDIAEWEEGTECADCSSEIAQRTDRGFAFGEQLVLCFECATRRGGSYDAERDEWMRAPNLDGLASDLTAAALQ
jgi:hypothetical protein